VSWSWSIADLRGGHSASVLPEGRKGEDVARERVMQQMDL
jgi:hypothetical protein